MDFNNPDTWFTEDIHVPPSGVDVLGYQGQINQICGLAFNGQPNVKLVWMPEIENYSLYYAEWDDAGFGKKSHLRGQYVYHTFWDGDKPLDLPPPRWALKQFVHPAQYANDELTRWAKKVDGQQTLLREIRPPKSASGYYAPLLRIGRHGKGCCKEAKKDRLTCWGQYREPDDKYLVLLRNAITLRERENEQRSDEPLSQETLMAAAREGLAIEQHQNAVGDAWLDKLIDDNLEELVAFYTGVKRVPQEYSLN